MTELYKIEDVRDLIIGDIETVEFNLLQLTQSDCPVTHRFSPGLYIREVFMPAGTIAIGHHQNFAHYNVMLKGKVLMLNTDGTTTELTAPRAFTGQEGRKIGYVLEDMVWQNIYPTSETDIEKLEETYLTKSDTWKSDKALRFNMQQLEHETDRLDYEQMLIDVGVSHEIAVSQSENEADRIDIEEVKIIVDDSPIQGRGIFATDTFLAGEIIFPARINGLRTQAGRYTNHSINPNSAMVKYENDDIYLVAIENIRGQTGGQNGEEITINYRQAIATNKEVICQQ